MKNKLSSTEKRTAYLLTLPAVCLVFAIILFPKFANIWISFKEVELKDIRIPEPRAKKIVKSISGEDNKIKFLYKLRNSSLLQEIRNVKFEDKYTKNLKPLDLDQRCIYKKNKIKCDFGTWPAKYKENFEIIFEIADNSKINKKELKSIKPKLDGDSDNIFFNTNFTLKNFKKVIFENEFLDLLLTTFYYTFFGTVGSIVFGILTAQMVNQKFYGRTFMRSVLLFPYVAPVVALAYTRELLLDQNSGTLNS